MNVTVQATDYAAIEPMRERYREEANCQIVHDSILRRRLADPYFIVVDGQIVGYTGIWNHHYPGRLMETFIAPPFRRHAVEIFWAVVETVRPTQISAQTNLPLDLLFLYDHGKNIRSENILFADAFTSDLPSTGAIFRRRRPEDKKDDDWMLELDGVVVAYGGFLTHYNPPYADVYMEVEEAFRRRGFGSYFVQEVKKACYAAGHKPAARCNEENLISRKTLAKAGLLPVARKLVGDVVF